MTKVMIRVKDDRGRSRIKWVEKSKVYRVVSTRVKPGFTRIKTKGGRTITVAKESVRKLKEKGLIVQEKVEEVKKEMPQEKHVKEEMKPVEMPKFEYNITTGTAVGVGTEETEQRIREVHKVPSYQPTDKSLFPSFDPIPLKIPKQVDVPKLGAPLGTPTKEPKRLTTEEKFEKLRVESPVSVAKTIKEKQGVPTDPIAKFGLGGIEFLESAPYLPVTIPTTISYMGAKMLEGTDVTAQTLTSVKSEIATRPVEFFGASVASVGVGMGVGAIKQKVFPKYKVEYWKGSAIKEKGTITTGKPTITYGYKTKDAGLRIQDIKTVSKSTKGNVMLQETFFSKKGVVTRRKIISPIIEKKIVKGPKPVTKDTMLTMESETGEVYFGVRGKSIVSSSYASQKFVTPVEFKKDPFKVTKIVGKGPSKATQVKPYWGYEYYKPEGKPGTFKFDYYKGLEKPVKTTTTGNTKQVLKPKSDLVYKPTVLSAEPDYQFYAVPVLTPPSTMEAVSRSTIFKPSTEIVQASKTEQRRITGFAPRLKSDPRLGMGRAPIQRGKIRTVTTSTYLTRVAGRQVSPQKEMTSARTQPPKQKSASILAPSKLTIPRTIPTRVPTPPLRLESRRIKGGSFRSLFSPSKRVYQPSLGGLIGGKTLSLKPTGKLTGIGIRRPLKRKKKRASII